ncbi:pyridoxal phosphate-dependent aminotransferase [Pararoseomonas indoligenes]|uniref:Aminotransferase n=1 Tax=Roseomonas indoligenes TaxID=2820811 RepID=A0A940S6W4_9PROT|nr:pyridoxal phosphate-dependent aminotransferase [Pararoseomonas indoligenes]MBP0494335.1 pyridoxal phosphate-dependent aminotransferase [Pararoseomonas indoligenes]
MITLASRLDAVAPSASVVMTQRSRELAASGNKVIALTQGQPDFPTPPHAIEAAHRAALEGQTKYPPLAGTAPIKEAIRRKFRRENGLDYEADEILVGNGGKQILYNAMMATLNPGDEVIIPRPFWISYADMARLGGATPVPVDCPQSNGFKLRPEDLEAAITPRTRWVVLNFPNNPTGAACTRAEMRAIADVILRHPQVMVLSDDMYEHLLYDGFEFCTIAQVEPALRDRVLTVNGVSKTYAMTGWRVGYCGGPRALIKGMTNMQGQSTGGASSIGQAAAVAALDGPQDFLAERAESFRIRRNLVVDLLNEARGVTCHKPEGAFYVFPDISGCIGRTTPGGRRITTDAEFAMALLEEAHVGTVYGAAYGMSPHVRISYAINPDDLREGCARVQEFCQSLR